ncbi:oxidoreductase [Weizmannia acidilactici]|uniref:Oxidoreductase n=1 Tax=Weizmannia acidilactici TaxID=2607726 RepID=A0A5J4J4C2_9BACI|nr:aldo/keto reductase [Weizmannia acidilactici]GER67614.1 oxidoreductase [Weizmannia acidilactici]GER69836.1 oxidoreductase [Weizmannia acidilactici]GER75166.1 oxidoreductase [Weizmannia acidilactici]
MKRINLGKSGILGSEIALGCMRMDALSEKDAQTMIETAVEHGINFFDHADKYGKGESESIFANALKNTSIKREDIILQSKCGIEDRMYNFSKEHILEAVDGSLQRLKTDYLDILLLHRPDPLMEPEEIAEAFSILQNSGKVRQFGVSNFHPYQVDLVQKYISQKLIVNQLQFSIAHTGMIDFGMHVNMKDERSINHDGGVLEYSRLHDITIQAWSPFQYGFFEGVFIDNPKFPELNEKLGQLAEEKGVSKMAIATAWILKHPAKIQVIVGTMNPGRLEKIAEASNIALTRQEWYDIYFAAGNDLP